MAQTAPPLPGEGGTPRPLPRGGRPTRSRDTRPRFQPFDALWMALLAVVFVVIGSARHTRAVDLAAATGVIFLTYLIGWRSSGRSTGVIAGLLLAASGPFVLSTSQSLQTDLFALLSLGALFAFVAGSSLAALALAALAVWLRADGIALGLMLMIFTLIQHRRHAFLGALIFLIPTLAALFIPHAVGKHFLTSGTFGFHPTLLDCLITPAMLFAAWFLLPFFGEMADPVRRARWLPIVIWTLLYAMLASVLTFGHTNAFSISLVLFLPLWFLLVGAGLARLLPVMTGDLPIPWLRYTVATLSVLSLVAIRARVEWAPVSHSAVAPVPKATLVPASNVSAPLVTPPPPLLTKPIIAHSTVQKKAMKSKVPSVLKSQAAKPKAIKSTVRQYVLKNGRLVRRSKWAIQWDMTHP